jgi:hypothetical protein
MPKRKEVTATKTKVKAPAVKKSKSKAKPKVEEPKELTVTESFTKIYAQTLFNAAYNWSYHTDSGVFYDIAQSYTYKEGPWTAIYQPTKLMKENDECHYCVIFTCSLSSDEYECIESIGKINELFLESYNEVLKVTNNKWLTEVKEGTFEEVAKVISPLDYDDRRGVLKMKFELLGWSSGSSSHQWFPIKIAQYLGIEPYWIYNKEGIYDEKNVDELCCFTEEAMRAYVSADDDDKEE